MANLEFTLQFQEGELRRLVGHVQILHGFSSNNTAKKTQLGQVRGGGSVSGSSCGHGTCQPAGHGVGRFEARDLGLATNVLDRIQEEIDLGIGIGIGIGVGNEASNPFAVTAVYVLDDENETHCVGAGGLTGDFIEYPGGDGWFAEDQLGDRSPLFDMDSPAETGITYLCIPTHHGKWEYRGRGFPAAISVIRTVLLRPRQ